MLNEPPGTSRETCSKCVRWTSSLVIFCWSLLCVVDLSPGWWPNGDTHERRWSNALALSILTLLLVIVVARLLRCAITQDQSVQTSNVTTTSVCGLHDTAVSQFHFSRCWTHESLVGAFITHCVLICCGFVWILLRMTASWPQITWGLITTCTLTLLSFVCILVGIRIVPSRVFGVLHEKKLETNRTTFVIDVTLPAKTTGSLMPCGERMADEHASPMCVEKLRQAASFPNHVCSEELDLCLERLPAPSHCVSWEYRRLYAAQQEELEELATVTKRNSKSHTEKLEKAVEHLSSSLALPPRKSRWNPVFEDPTWNGTLEPVGRLRNFSCPLSLDEHSTVAETRLSSSCSGSNTRAASRVSPAWAERPNSDLVSSCVTENTDPIVRTDVNDISCSNSSVSADEVLESTDSDDGYTPNAYAATKCSRRQSRGSAFTDVTEIL
eukprot:TRINITY_DN44097_c0_g1_i1.p1 TRINITY_DN44097_c0_g1~~TRINITY_DN44097_c0_g1_i1.p1  ORF type:complete len:440 (+),score=44.24 TRINITY_DN44097_c0_g1_i1:194-1513(+)